MVTSSVMAASYYIRVAFFSNVLMQKKRRGIRKTSDLSKSDCSIHDICRQRYRVYYESYRDEIVQGRVRSETASLDTI